MGKIVSFFQNASFDPAETAILGQAYQLACRSLHDTGQPEIVKEIIAKRIIKLAKQGERDPQRLCVGALNALGIPSADT